MSAGLADRIRWILRAKGWPERELARRANLKSETHVGVILRCNAAKVDALDAIARAASVNFTWLALGDGPRERDIFDPGHFGPLPYPDMKLALDMGRAEGMSDEFLKAFAGQKHDVTDDLRPSEWWELLRIEHVAWRRYGRDTTKGQGTS